MAGSMATTHHASSTAQRGNFKETHWSVVLAASQKDSSLAHAALTKLCENYWYPLYAFIRRRGHDPESAKDLTQEFFSRLIEKDYVRVADPHRGRFRTFLLTCLERFLNGERRKKETVKRGGQYTFLALDEMQAEGWYSAEAAEDLSPEKLYDRRWALTLLDDTYKQLRKEFAEAGKPVQFEALQIFLSGSKGGEHSYLDLGRQLGLSENAARQAAFRLRTRYGDLLRTRVAETVSGPRELEAEMAHLLAAVGTQ